MKLFITLVIVLILLFGGMPIEAFALQMKQVGEAEEAILRFSGKPVQALVMPTRMVADSVKQKISPPYRIKESKKVRKLHRWAMVFGSLAFISVLLFVITLAFGWVPFFLAFSIIGLILSVLILADPYLENLSVKVSSVIVGAFCFLVVALSWYLLFINV